MTVDLNGAVAWRVRAVQPLGRVEVEQVFHVRPQMDAENAARRHALRLEEACPHCKVKVEPLCFYPELTP